MALPLIPLAIMGSTLFQVGGAYAQGQANAAAMQANAAINVENAMQTVTETGTREAMFRRQTWKALGRQSAAVAQSGVAFSGSALDVFEQSVAEAEFDALAIRYEGQSKVRSLLQQAELGIAGAEDAEMVGMLNTGAALLGGASDYGMYKASIT